MKKGIVLVTDSLFIYDKHVLRLRDAGYEVERLDKPKATEDELCEAIQGKVGYLLGGIEVVTDKVLDSAKGLKAIVFTGTGWKAYIPSWEKAVSNGVKIGNVPDATTYGVAEYQLAMIMAMNRKMFGLGRTGEQTFQTVDSICDLTVGIVGFGRIGQKTAEMLKGIGVGQLVYWNRSDKVESAKKCSARYMELHDLFAQCDIICVSLADDAGDDFLESENFNLMKTGSLLVSISHRGIINEDDLANVVRSNGIRVALDFTPKECLTIFPPDQVYYSTETAAYNTHNVLDQASDSATETILNLLDHGEDINRVA